MGTSPVIIDISHYQPEPDWEALLKAGIVGVILKCTEGNGYVDDTFRHRYDAAIAAGLAVSTYHFMRTGDMQAQMNHYLNTLKPRVGERVCLDHEDPKVTLEYLESCVAYLMSDSRALQITIYSGHVIKDQLAGAKRSDILANNTSLWLAQYGPTPTWPQSTWATWTLWQYTDQGKIAGISGNVDCNRFNGSDQSCVAWMGPPSVVPVPEPEPIPEPGITEIQVSVIAAAGLLASVTAHTEQPSPPEAQINIEIACPAGVQISVSVNGEQVAIGTAGDPEE